MITLNNILEIGKTGLLAHRARMAVTAHNIANVNTPGYHRQRVLLQTQPPISPFGSAYNYYFGSGVKVADVIRNYNQMTEATLRDQTASSAYHGQLAHALKDAEALLAGSEDANLGVRLQEFWSSWQDVANNSDSPAYRNILLQRTNALTAEFNNLYNRLSLYRTDILHEMGDEAGGAIARDVTELNSLTNRIAELNKKISIISLYGSNPNDLLDSRDLLLGQLSELANVDMFREQDGTYTISLDGQTLVSGANHYKITVTNDGVGDEDITLEVALADGGSAVINPGEGRLGGWLEAANVFEDLMKQLDNMAAEMVMQVNQLHYDGYDLAGNTEIYFFDPAGITADSIRLSDMVIGQPNNIAAAETRHLLDPGPPPVYTPNVGDGAVALRIAELCTQRFEMLNNRSFGNYYTDMLTTLGVRIESESDLANNAHNVITALQASLAGETGVNLDEEMVEMLAAQRAFAACSKIITVVDDMLDTIINRMKR